MSKEEPKIFRECVFCSPKREPIFREAARRCGAGAGVGNADFLFLSPYKIKSAEPNMLLLDLVSRSPEDLKRFWKVVDEVDQEIDRLQRN